MTSLAAAHRMLCRAGYGPRPGEPAALARGGLSAWLEEQLALPAEEPAVMTRIQALELPLRYAAGPGEQAVDERRPPGPAPLLRTPQIGLTA